MLESRREQLVKKRKNLEQCPKMLKLSIQRNYIVKNVFRLGCVEAPSQGEIQTGSGTETESGKVTDWTRNSSESGKDTDWIRNRD